MKITRPNTVAITDLNVKRFTEDLYKLTNRNISFGTQVNAQDQNIAGQMVEILNTGPANSLNTVTHNLGRIPNFIDLKYKNIAGDWYYGGSPWTTTLVYIAFTTANMHVRIFIH
jgi:hypothetical protein